MALRACGSCAASPALFGSRTHDVLSKACESAAGTDALAPGNASIASPVARLILCHACGIACAARCETACALNPFSLCAAHCSCLLRCVAQALARRREAHRREWYRLRRRAGCGVGESNEVVLVCLLRRPEPQPRPELAAEHASICNAVMCFDATDVMSVASNYIIVEPTMAMADLSSTC